MQIETFEAKEINADGTNECDKEALELIETLGLDGQKSLVSGEGNLAARSPWRKMTQVEAFVYSTLCPERSLVKEYNDGPIPTRVLRIAREAMHSFKKLEVWHPASADIKDPVLVGVREEGYKIEFFILARWGEVLEPLAQMVPLASKLFRERLAGKLKAIKAQVDRQLVTLETTGDGELSTLKISEPYFHGGL